MLQDIKEEAEAFIEDFSLQEPLAGLLFCWATVKKFWKSDVLCFWFIVLPIILFIWVIIFNFPYLYTA